jgi:NTP pyrophosphatase (non-canonical NTP hydrolase)
MEKEMITPIIDLHNMKVSGSEEKFLNRMSICDLVDISHRIASNNNFWEDYEDSKGNSWRFNNMISTKLLLIVTEISEATEVLRNGDINKSENIDKFAEELADAVIRISDLAGAMGIDLENAIIQKTKINEKRPIKHGKQF